MKKLLVSIISLAAAIGLLGANDFTDRDVELANFNYVYYPAQKVCHKNTFAEKRDFFTMFKSKQIILNKPFINDAGYYLQMAGEDKGGQYKIHFMDTYGECKFFEAVMIEDKDVKADAYKNLKDPTIN